LTVVDSDGGAEGGVGASKSESCGMCLGVERGEYLTDVAGVSAEDAALDCCGL
jgi:hypothetical protein